MEDKEAPKDSRLVSILKAYRRKTLMEHLVGPFGSFLLHVVLVIVLIQVMVFSVQEKDPQIEVKIMEADAVDLEKFEEELEKLDDMKEMTDIAAPDDVVVDVDAPVADAPVTEDTTMDMEELNVLQDVMGPLVMKGLYEGRSSSGRAKSLGRFAGKHGKATEEAVIKALEWLKRNQKPDGSWAGRHPAAMTGLGLLTFLAHGETTSSANYGPTVRKAIEWMVNAYNNGGGGKFSAGFVPGRQADGGDNESYAHGIATYAVSEAYALTKIPDLKAVMEGAVYTIINGQQAGGLWDYRFAKGARWDLSVSGWQMQALKAAYTAGAEVPGIKDAMEKATEGVKRAQNYETGRFGYSSPGAGNDSITGVGVLSLQLLGHSEDKEARLGLQAMRAWDCEWDKAPPWGLYAWYYISQAKFHEGGPSWAGWNNKLAPTLTKAQNEDGSWPAPTTEKGEASEKDLGPVYSTTLAALTLQVYYRHLPTYQPIKVEPKEEEKKDDVAVEII